MRDDWRNVDERLYWIDQLLRWRPIVAAMRRLVAAIKTDPRFHDLRPSMSHDALVLRRGANPEVWCCWLVEQETYEVREVSSAGRELVVRAKAQAATIDRFLDLLSEYLARSPIHKSNRTQVLTNESDDEQVTHAWGEVNVEYDRLAQYDSEKAFVAAMRKLVDAVHDDVRFRDVDPRVARGESRSGGPVNSLVFHLLARRSVWAWWDETEQNYHVTLIEGDAMLQHATSTNLADVIDLLVAYLAQASA